MASPNWCGKDCSLCEAYCELDESMPCSANCEGLSSITGEPNGEQCKTCEAILIKL